MSKTIVQINPVYTKIALGIIFYLIFAHNLVFPQNEHLRFQHITIEEGISQNSIFSIMQDKNGFMWFASQDGLNKFDGYTCIVYKNDPDDEKSLSSNHINPIYEDREGNIWVGSNGGGLCKFDPVSEAAVRYRHDVNGENTICNDRVWAILEDSKNNFWLGTSGGLDRLNKDKGLVDLHFENDKNNPDTISHNEVLTIYEDRDNILWIGNDKGIDRFDPEKKIFIHYINDRNYPVWTIAEDKAGNIWAGTFSGRLYKIEKEIKLTPIPFADMKYLPFKSPIRDINPNTDGMFWISTYGEGLCLFDPVTEKTVFYKNNPFDPKSINDNFLWTTFIDRTETLWIGTQSGGVNKYNKYKEKFPHFKNDPANPQSLPSNNITSIYQDTDGIIWVGTKDKGLCRIDREKGEYINYQYVSGKPDALSDNYVKSIYEDSKGYFWIGTNKGLNKFDKKTQKFKRYIRQTDTPADLCNNIIYSIFEDKERTLWLGTFFGVSKYNYNSDNFSSFYSSYDSTNSLTSNFVRAVFEDKNGEIWLGTDYGISRLNKERTIFRNYKNKPEDRKSLSSNTVRCFFEDDKGTIYVGTDLGVNIFDRTTETFSSITTRDGLPNNVVYSILPDNDGNLWLSTNKGLSRYNPVKKTFRNYDVNDGLQSNEYNNGAVFRSKSGELFFGGINGFNCFYPDKVLDNPNPPQMLITSFSKFGKKTNFAKEIYDHGYLTISYKENYISFEFAGLDYANSHKNLYAYKLEGFDADWINCGNRRFANYTNLDGGDYTFMVKGANNDGIWNEKGTSVKIRIIPPYWKTNWFRFSIALIIIISSVSFYRRRIGNIERRRVALEKEVEKRTQEIKQKNLDIEKKNEELIILNDKKNELLGMAAHDLRNPLTGIMGYISYTLDLIKMKDFDPDNEYESLNIVLKETEKMSRLINSILDVSAIEAGKVNISLKDENINEIIEESVKFYTNIAHMKNISIDFIKSSALPSVNADKSRITQVVDNLLSNAIKYTQQNGNVRISCEQKNENLYVYIKDSGQGLNEEDMRRLFGLFEQLSSKPTGNEKRSGLGLAIAKKIIDMHNGKIGAESKKGEGTTFYFSLPVSKKS